MLKTCYPAGSRQIRPGWPGWALGFDFDHALIVQLKLNIPVGCREWWPEDKLWWVAAEEGEALAQLFPDFAQYRDQPVLPGFIAPVNTEGREALIWRAEQDIKELWG